MYFYYSNVIFQDADEYPDCRIISQLRMSDAAVEVMTGIYNL